MILSAASMQLIHRSLPSDNLSDRVPDGGYKSDLTPSHTPHLVWIGYCSSSHSIDAFSFTHPSGRNPVHEEEFLARMSIIKPYAARSSQTCPQTSVRHLIDQGTFREPPRRVRRRGRNFHYRVNHAEGQLIVVVAPEIWILLHIARKCSSSPCSIYNQSQDRVLHVTGNLRHAVDSRQSESRRPCVPEDRVQML